MSEVDAQQLREQIRRGRDNFIFMAVSYSLGVFNDNFFRMATMLIAVSVGYVKFQQHAIVFFCLPYLLFAAPAGWMADRFPKRRIIIGAKALEVAAMVCGASGIMLNSWGLMVAMVSLMGLQSAIFSPSLCGSIPELYPASYVTAANARLKVATTAAVLLGVGTAGLALQSKMEVLPGLELGRVGVATTVLGVSVLGLLASFGVPRRKAASPRVRFPWKGPLHTLQELWRIRKDRLLATVILVDAFVWFLGSTQLLIINLLGIQQYGLSEGWTGGLALAELVGVAAGGLLGSRIARGRYWYGIVTPAVLALAPVLACVSLVPLLPDALEPGALAGLFCLAGLLGGMILIPCEAFVQVRPSADKKGATIAAANFASMGAILLSGPVHLMLLGRLVEPTTCFAFMGGLTLALGLALTFDLPTGPGNLLDGVLARLVKGLFSLRYRIAVTGLREVAARGTDGILFLPNHPALIDPVIMMATLHGRFGPRAWASREQINRPVIRTLAGRLGVRAVPAVERLGEAAREVVGQALGATIDDLKGGRCVLLYPSGHAYRHYRENLRGNSAVHTLLQALPEVRVVLVRTTGLWGSRFSWAGGRAPEVGRTLWKGCLSLLSSGVFFAPRRRVTIEFHEPEDLPRDADRDALNQFIEDFYNQSAAPNTYVPYSIWERGGVRRLPEPFIGVEAGDVDRVPAATRQAVLEHLKELTGASQLAPEQDLARDLGLDSLARAELIAWTESEFGFPAGDPDSMQAVADVLLAACGEAVRGEPAQLRPIDRKWLEQVAGGGRLGPPVGETIPEAFLRAARRAPGRAIAADQVSGVRTYRDLMLGIAALRPDIERLPGERVGIMLPASVGAGVLYLAALFAGKTPVMVNWTVGRRNLAHCLDLAGVTHILTSRTLVQRLAAHGTDLSDFEKRFIYIEDLRTRISLPRKLTAWLRSRLGRPGLSKPGAAQTAVILFTSGSESLPKAVPLTHANLLANVTDACKQLALSPDDRLMGILPPFHSFGLTATILMPLCTGLAAAYHPDPTEAGMLGRLIQAYEVRLLVGTPTFLSGILRASTPEQLSTLRIVVTGAEACPERVYRALAERCPQTTVLEGYGVTECSPVVSVNTEEVRREGTIGQVLPSLEHAIVDVDSGRRVPQGTQGMLLVRGPSVFAGYLRGEGASPFVEMEGKRWYRTGDLVREDADGVLTFCGRLKRFAKLGGEMISLPAIESVLEVHFPPSEEEGPRIAVGVTADDDHPEIVLFSTLNADRQEVNSYIREAGLSPLHSVRRVVLVDSIPLLGTGKTDYRALGERL